jgi:hypothetical protein
MAKRRIIKVFKRFGGDSSPHSNKNENHYQEKNSANPDTIDQGIEVRDLNNRGVSTLAKVGGLN